MTERKQISLQKDNTQAALEFAINRTNKRLEIFKEHNSGIPEKDLMREFAQNEGVYWEDLEPIINAAKDQLDQYREDIGSDRQAAFAALDSLQSSLKDALHSLLVSHCAGYVSSTEYSIKRSSIEGHISNCEIIRAALSAPDVNRELLEALKSLLSALDNEGLTADYHAYVYQAEQAIARAEAQKVGE